MAKGLSITAGVNQVKVFECPNCKETINTSAQQCPFCSAPIDASAAESAAEVMANVNQACSDASYLRIMAGTMPVFFGISLLPVVGTLGYWGLTFLVFAVPVMAIRWWIKFGSIKADESDFRRAKRTTLVATGIWVLGLIVWIVRVGLVRLF
jgi:hypothetical protein